MKVKLSVGPRFSAYHVVPDSPLMQQNFLVALASLEAQTSHTLGKDVLRIAKINGIQPLSVEGFQEFPHRGIGGLVQLPHEQRPRAIVVGSREFLEECGLQIPDILEVTVRKWGSEPDVIIALGGWDGWVRGVVKWETSDRSRKNRNN